MSLVCATTMNKEYYDTIGKLMLRSWMKFFPADATLYLYLEDFKLELFDSRIIQCSWESDIDPIFKQWSVRQPPGDGTHRSHKFTKKAMAQIATWNNKINIDFLWLDADLVFLKSIPNDIFERIVGPYPLASWGAGSFESGTVFINTRHPDWPKIKTIYEGIYFGEIEFPVGTDTTVVYPSGWLDGEILGYAAATSGVQYLNLNSLCTAKTNTPLNHSWLGEYMIHFKAKRKNTLLDTVKNDWKRTDLAEMLEND
jgi:hypothetical protein